MGPEKWQTKLRKTVVGAVFVAGAVVMKWQGWFADWFIMSLIGVGGYLIAGDLVRGLGRFVKETGQQAADGIKAVLGAFRK
jgi:hypothetical protein